MAEYQGYEDPRTDQGNPLSIQDPSGNAENLSGQPEDIGQSNQKIPPQDSFDPNTWALNYKGQTVYPTDRNHLINLAQQGWSYSQNMEKVNERQREIDKLEAQFGQYQELDNAMRQNPELAQRLNQVYTDYTNGNNQIQQTAQNTDPYNEDPRFGQLQQQNQQLMKEMHDIKQWREQQINNDADQKLTASIEELKKRYPDQPWDTDNGHGTLHQRLIKHALDNDIHDVKLAYKDLMWDSLQTNARANALKQQKEKQQKDFQNGIVNTGYASSSQNNNELNYNPNDDYGDISDKAIRMLGG